MANKGIYLEVFVALIFCEVGRSAVMENDQAGDYYQQFQKIPPAQQTAMKMYKYFISGTEGRIVKRQQSRPLDITFILDSSSSISSHNFRKGNRAIQQLTRLFEADSQYAIITIATRAKIHSKFTSRAEAGRLLRGLRRSGGKTNTQEALALCRDLYRGSDSGLRPGSLRRILVVTDGHSNIKRRLTVPNATRLKLMGVEVFVIAIGEYLDGIDEMVRMASSTDAHMYRVVNVDGLLKVVSLVPKQQNRPWLNEIFG